MRLFCLLSPFVSLKNESTTSAVLLLHKQGLYLLWTNKQSLNFPEHLIPVTSDQSVKYTSESTES